MKHSMDLESECWEKGVVYGKLLSDFQHNKASQDKRRENDEVLITLLKIALGHLMIHDNTKDGKRIKEDIGKKLAEIHIKNRKTEQCQLLNELSLLASRELPIYCSDLLPSLKPNNYHNLHRELAVNYCAKILLEKENRFDLITTSPQEFRISLIESVKNFFANIINDVAFDELGLEVLEKLNNRNVSEEVEQYFKKLEHG